jgi:hypothetical protein
MKLVKLYPREFLEVHLEHSGFWFCRSRFQPTMKARRRKRDEAIAAVIRKIGTFRAAEDRVNRLPKLRKRWIVESFFRAILAWFGKMFARSEREEAE